MKREDVGKSTLAVLSERFNPILPQKTIHRRWAQKPVTNGVLRPQKMAENKWVTGVIISISGVITLLTTGRGPPCINSWAYK